MTCSNATDLARYLKGSGDFRSIMASSATIGEEDEARERLVRGLYAIAGIDTAALPDFPGRANLLAKLKAEGFLGQTGSRAFLTAEGGFNWEAVSARIRRP